MRIRYLPNITLAGMLMLLVTFASVASAQDKAKPASDAAVAQENLAYAIGVQAYLFGQPIMDCD